MIRIRSLVSTTDDGTPLALQGTIIIQMCCPLRQRLVGKREGDNKLRSLLFSEGCCILLEGAESLIYRVDFHNASNQHTGGMR